MGMAYGKTIPILYITPRENHVQDRQRERHQAGRAMDTTVRLQSHSEDIGQQTQVKTQKQGNHVDERQRSGSLADLGPRWTWKA
jgi:hypothetical protein